ncbi:DHA2 family efflux MFS transporter permease subunit [Patulibacter brassicae]|jgi:EmrB/QacA subfamily drug resistance transporter|uniref:DHA2 family efflux MFS transporter permease subunit n=1 Tax=Patulibacter brassicae TaxID=1705717 RepID=A0ABU4VQ16_9ACTN|nr:DHA2 family efflux MFS transporter permease subunit [Patulibacter brassicae]MDX8152943.1 DHA2 family efflux MFS transporter permease subunit [Patulibacter brassicae]
MPAPPAFPLRTVVIVALAVFMTALDNLVVGVALPSIQRDLGGSLESLEWTVNAYTLAFAVFLLTGAALGDRFGRRRMFLLGLGIFTGASAVAALAPSIELLVAARAIQGIGAAIVTPLTLTILADAVPAQRRGLAIGLWGGIGGLGVAVGPAVGGAVVEGLHWSWIFWLNVPIGLALLPIARRELRESFGPGGASTPLDRPGLLLVTGGLFGLTFGVIRSQVLGWGSTTVVASLAVGVLLLGAFLAWERRTPAPMLPLGLFRSVRFSATNGLSFAMFFGMFGSIFLLSQFFQIAQGYGPLEAGLRTLPWTGMPVLIAPIAGILSDRIGARPLLVTGMALQAVALFWISQVSSLTVPYGELVPPFVLAGVGMALVFAPVAGAVLASAPPELAGKASGATNAIRETGGVFGVAVLATIFASHGSHATPQGFTDGLLAALPVGAAVLAVGAVIGLLAPGRPAPAAAVAEGGGAPAGAPLADPA